MSCPAMDLPVSPVFPNTPNGRKQYLHWRQQHRLRGAGRTPPHAAADDPSASTRLEMDDIVDSDDEHNPKEVLRGPEPSSQNLRKQWSNVQKSYEAGYAAMTRGAAADRAAATTVAGPPVLPRPMTANIGTLGKNGATEELDAIDFMVSRMGDNPLPTAQDGLMW